MKKMYYVYTHKSLDGNLFYVGVSYHYTKGNKYTRAFGFKLRNNYWLDIFENNKKQCVVEIISDFLSKEDAYNKEIELISQYGKIHNNTGILANIYDGGQLCAPSKSICSYDFEGNFLKKYDKGVNQVVKELGLKEGSRIYQSICYGTGTSGGLRFKYMSQDYQKKIEPYILCNQCYQYTKSGKFLKKWRTVEDAAKELKIDRSSIRRSIYGKFNHAGGFVWSYKPIEFKKDAFKIGQYDMEDNLLNTFANAAVAAKFVNNYNASILLCCKGKMKSTSGFKWKYIKID